MPGIHTSQTKTISALSLFSSITLRGLVDEENGSGTPVQLNRDISFPDQVQCRVSNYSPVWEFSAQARLPPDSGYHIELEIGDLLGHGSSGHVYAVRVVNITPDPAENLRVKHALDTLPDLCIKLSEPEQIRGIAREAWFYEQLDSEGLHGVVVPRNYGFFTAPCSPSRVIPWRSESWKFHYLEYDVFEDADGSGLMEFEPLPREPDGTGTIYHDDEHQSHQTSKWLTYRQSCESPLVAVMLMEKLGEPPKKNEWDGFEDPKHMQEVRELVEDLAWKGFHCQDLRWNQFVFAPDALPCPRHLRKHKFHLVDFVLTDRIPLNKEDREYVEKVMFREGLYQLSFWGIGPWLS